jgi:hypothetical protein
MQDSELMTQTLRDSDSGKTHEKLNNPTETPCELAGYSDQTSKGRCFECRSDNEHFTFSDKEKTN